MNCKKCGAEIPYGSFGNVKCEYCNTVNYVPTPEEKKEKEAPRFKPLMIKTLSLLIVLLALLMTLLVCLYVFVFLL